MEQSEGEFIVSTNRVMPAKRWQVLRLLTRVEDFPSYLPEIKSCKVLSRTRTESVTSWNVEMDGVPIVWKEKASFS